MPHDVLHDDDVCSVSNHLRPERMPQQMRMQMFLQLRLAAGSRHPVVHDASVDWKEVFIREHMVHAIEVSGRMLLPVFP